MHRLTEIFCIDVRASFFIRIHFDFRINWSYFEVTYFSFSLWKSLYYDCEVLKRILNFADRIFCFHFVSSWNQILRFVFVLIFSLSGDSVFRRGARLHRGQPRGQRGTSMSDRKHRRRMPVAERRKGKKQIWTNMLIF